MMKCNRFYLRAGLFGLVLGLAAPAGADISLRYQSSPSSKEHHRHQPYYDKAPRTINRPISQYRKQQLHKKPRHHRGAHRHPHRHPHIRHNYRSQHQQGIYFSNYGFIPYGHRHTRQCPEWHSFSFVLRLNFSH